MLQLTRISLTPVLLLGLAPLSLTACFDAATDHPAGGEAEPDAELAESDADAGEPEPETPGIPAEIYAVAGGCFTAALADGRRLGATADGADFAFATEGQAAAFRLRASDLGEYLLYDAERHYLIAVQDGEGDAAPWATARTDDPERIRIRLPLPQERSDAEWGLESSGLATDSYRLRHLNSGLYLGAAGLAEAPGAAAVRLIPREGCVEYPEMSVDAHGEVRSAPWDDGAVFGVADIHEHMVTHVAYGGGGVFHGHNYHRLGVEHALGDCEATHGPGGERDILGYVFNTSWIPDVMDFILIASTGTVGEFIHHTDGWPTFTDWPNARKAPTHNVMYYRWLERAWMSGLRVIVELATGNSALCSLMVGVGSQSAPLGCNDMRSVENGIAANRALERYIDAQWGGPGQGWLRIVESPAEARDVINQGKLAVVLGIEISNLYDCFITPPPGMPVCDADHVRAQVQKFHDLGARVVFPVHKFDNGFGPGDGHRGPIEIGNLINSGHYSNYVLDCPTPGPGGFDRGAVTFGGLNKPRDEYLVPGPLDMTGVQDNLMGSLLPILEDIGGAPLEGDYCQNGTLTDLGELLLDELMARGVLIDVAHLPQRSLVRAMEILDEKEYPALSTHWNTVDGKVYRHGGTSVSGLGRCGDPDEPGTMVRGFLNRAAEIREANGLVAQPISFDFNGLAGAPRARFGEESPCSQPQANPIVYPFRSYDGGVEFTQPQLGVRTVDFNTEGMLHIGLLPEYIEDVRRDGAGDEELEPLFRTAEVFLQVWERAQARRTR